MIKAFLHTLPPGRKFILLIILTAVFLLLAALSGMLMAVLVYGKDILPQLSHIDLNDPRNLSALKLMQIINMAGGLLFPAIIFLYITEEKPWAFSKLNNMPSVFTLFLTIILVLSVQPVIGYLSDINAKMELPAFMKGVENWMQQAEEQANALSNSFLKVNTWNGYLMNLFMIALLPAFTEELVFRGIIAELFRNITRSIHWASILSAVLFAAIHLQFYGFLPRFMLGIMLAYLLFRTGSLWVPILAHFINNFLSVTVDFLFNKEISQVSSKELGTTDNLLILALSAALSLSIFMLIRKPAAKNDYPLYHQQ